MLIWLVTGVSTTLAADVVQGANLLGMGGVGVAAPRDNAGITMNPGTLALRERYDFHVQGRVGPTAGLHWAATAVDGRTSDVVTAGLAYSGDRYEPGIISADQPGWSIAGEEIRNRKRNHDFVGAIAVPLLDRRLSIGLGAALSLYDHDQQGQGTSFDLHGGIAFAPVEAITVGISARNVLPFAAQDRPAEVRAGIRVEDPDSVAFEVNVGRGWLPGLDDWVADAGLASPVEDASDWMVAAGADARLGSVRLRAGAAWQGASRLPFVTLGVGSHEPDGLGFEYAVAVPVTSDLSFGATVHQISIRFAAEDEIEEE